MSPLRGSFIYSILNPTTHVVGYWYIAPPGLRPDYETVANRDL